MPPPRSRSRRKPSASVFAPYSVPSARRTSTFTLPSFCAIGESSAQYGMTAFLYGMVTLSASKSPPVKNAGRSSGATS